MIPRDLTQGYHPVLYVAGNSGVYMLTDNGQTWSLYPETTYGAATPGGDLPHVNVTSLSLSQGNVAVATGMPALAGPYQTFLFTGTLAAGSTAVAGITDTSGLAVGDVITGLGIPAGTTITAVNNSNHSLTLSNKATVSGSQSLSAADPTATPDPDLLLAGTYGEGAFAINLAPMLMTGTTQIDPSDLGGATSDGTPIVTTAAPTIDGLSEITGFGGATWISIYDETPGDSTYGQVIGGFDPQAYASGQSITPDSSNSTDAFGNFAIQLSKAFGSNSTAFTGTLTAGSAVVTGLASTTGLTVGEGVTGTGIPVGATIKSINATAGTITLSASATVAGSQSLVAGLKTIEVYATDDAGSRSTPVTFTFMLNANDLSHSAPTSAPPAPTLELTPITPPYVSIGVTGLGSIPVTSNTAPALDGTADAATSVTITETWLEFGTSSPNNPTMSFILPASDIASNGASETFGFLFQDFTDPSTGNLVTNGNFSIVAQATYTQSPYNAFGPSLPSTPPVVFQVDNTTPTSVSDFRLSPADDTGIQGDDVTTDRTPVFIGTTTPGYTVELFVNGQTAIQATVEAIPGYTGTLTAGSATVTGLIDTHSNASDTIGLAVGEVITGTGIPAGTTIKSINSSASTITLSNNATASGSQTLAAMNVDADNRTYNFAVQLPYALTSGETSLDVRVIDLAGNLSNPSNSVGVAITSTVADYNGGPASDPALFTRNTTSNQLQWIVQTPAGSAPPWFGTSGAAYSVAAGSANAVPFAGDFDGDGVTDLAYYNMSTATWTVYDSSNYNVQGASTFSMGTPNASIPVVGNFDANGPSEEAVFTVNAQGQGVWNVASILTGTRTFTFGQTGDIPLAGDFDGIGYDEAAVYRPSTGQFLVLNPTNGQTETFSIPGISTGVAGSSPSPDLSSLVPVPGQYDNQTYYNQAIANHQALPIFGRTEPAVFDPNTGVFTILGPGNVVYTVSGFQSGDIPAPADYLGQGGDQVVVYRPSTGQFIEGSNSGQMTTLATLGGSGDIPITAPLSYRMTDPPSTSPGTDPSNGGGSTGGGSTTTGGSTNTGGSTSTGSTTTGGSTNTGSIGSLGSSTTTTTTTGTSSQAGSAPTAPAPVSVAKNHHKKVVSKKAHPTKPAKPKKKAAAHPRKEAAHAVKKKVVHVVAAAHHSAAKAAVVTAGHAASKAHLVDLALDDVHVNLRRSNKKHGE